METDINKLKNIEDCRGKLKSIFTDEQIINLAKENKCPHYVLFNPVTKTNTYLFNATELNRWFCDNYITHSSGIFEQEVKFINYNASKPKSIVPKELSCIKNLFEIADVYTGSGIYFLCLDDKIQYIGQSKCVINRIGTHAFEQIKNFNTVFFIPCHIDKLNELEGSLIREFKPPYNFNSPTGLRHNKEKELSLKKSFFENT